MEYLKEMVLVSYVVRNFYCCILRPTVPQVENIVWKDYIFRSRYIVCCQLESFTASFGIEVLKEIRIRRNHSDRFSYGTLHSFGKTSDEKTRP